MAIASQQWMMGPWDHSSGIDQLPHELIYAFGEYIAQEEKAKNAFYNSYEAARKEFLAKSDAEKSALLKKLDEILQKYGGREENK